MHWVKSSADDTTRWSLARANCVLDLRLSLSLLLSPSLSFSPSPSLSLSFFLSLSFSLLHLSTHSSQRVRTFDEVIAHDQNLTPHLPDLQGRLQRWGWVEWCVEVNGASPWTADAHHTPPLACSPLWKHAIIGLSNIRNIVWCVLGRTHLGTN